MLCMALGDDPFFNNAVNKLYSSDYFSKALFSCLLFIGGFIPYLIQNQYVNNSINNENDEKNKN